MSEIFRKLNLKDLTEILVLNAPQSFDAELAALEPVGVLRQLEDAQAIDFAVGIFDQAGSGGRISCFAAAQGARRCTGLVCVSKGQL